MCAVFVTISPRPFTGALANAAKPPPTIAAGK
jgi:hypothetical protein